MSWLQGEELYSYDTIKAVADYYESTAGAETFSKWGSTAYDFALDASKELTEAEWGAECSKAGLNVFTDVGGNYANYSRNVSTVTNAVENTGNLAVKTAVKEGKVIAEPLEETVTTAGETIAKGGAVTGVSKVFGALAVAETVGAVYKDYKEHTDWWNDLSDRVFRTDGTSYFKPVGQLGLDPTYQAGIGEIIVRRITDVLGDTSYYKSFMPEKNVGSYVMEMANEGMFTPSIIIENEPAEGSARYEGELSKSYIIKAVNTANANGRFYLQRGYQIPIGMIETVWSSIQMTPDIDNYNFIDVDALVTDFDNSQLNVVIAKVNSAGVYEKRTSPEWIKGVFNTDNFIETWGFYCSIDNNTGRITLHKTHSTQSSSISYIPLWSSTSSTMCQTKISSAFSIYQEGGVEQAPLDEGAQIFIVPTGEYDLDAILQALRNQYPEWYKNSFTVDSYDPVSKTTTSKTYLPVSIPNNYPDADNPPANFRQPFAQTGNIPEDATKTQENLGRGNTPVIKIIAPTTNPEPNDTPKDPTAGMVTGGSNNLWAVYNPSRAEVSGVGAYLWSTDIGDLISKWFANPMDAIISLHLIYATPHTGARQNIILGYLDSGVQAPIVTNQFTEVDCGSIVVPEYFGDARDYSPYTQIYIYLPFIGIKAISTEDVIGCTLSVKYNVDVLTGAVLCNIFVTKKGATQILYTYAGNCSVQIPLTGADRTRLLSGAISAVSGAITGASVGGVAGAVAGASMGIINGLHGAGAIDRTGSFSANAGAMGVKTPYLIINRKEGYDATSFTDFYGLPSNTTVVLSSCKGYTRVKDIHVENIAVATQEEKTSIENMLKQGVVIN